MTKLENVALPPHGFLLTEDRRMQLEELRDQLFLMAGFVFAVTLEEERIPLEIKRSMLGQLFESYGLRIDEVLTALQWATQSTQAPTQRH
jgi:hypothetical protein